MPDFLVFVSGESPTFFPLSPLISESVVYSPIESPSSPFMSNWTGQQPGRFSPLPSFLLSVGLTSPPTPYLFLPPVNDDPPMGSVVYLLIPLGGFFPPPRGASPFADRALRTFLLPLRVPSPCCVERDFSSLILVLAPGRCLSMPFYPFHFLFTQSFFFDPLPFLVSESTAPKPHSPHFIFPDVFSSSIFYVQPPPKESPCHLATLLPLFPGVCLTPTCTTSRAPAPVPLLFLATISDTSSPPPRISPPKLYSEPQLRPHFALPMGTFNTLFGTPTLLLRSRPILLGSNISHSWVTFHVLFPSSLLLFFLLHHVPSRSPPEHE